MGEVAVEPVEEMEQEDDKDFNELDSVLNPRHEEKLETSVEEKKEEEVVETPPVEEVESKEEEVEEESSPGVDSATVELRRFIREQRRQIALLNSKVNRLSQKKESDDLDDLEEEEEDEKGGRNNLSEIERHQSDISLIAEKRGESLAEMVELMSLNKNFEDVRDVCTRERFDDIFELAAINKVQKEGGDVSTTQLAIEAEVWSMPNPYKYMYKIIKEYHPDFRVKEQPKTETPSTPTKKGAPAKSPVSALDLGRGGETKSISGWTAERIDNMDETELTKVPKEVYDKYLRGELD